MRADRDTTSVSLGGERLRQLRRQAGVSQLAAEAEAGLGVGYVQRIESGRVRQPERATLERLLEAIGARYGERRDVLAMFGYRVAAPLPDDGEVAWAREQADAELRAAPFPAYLLDCAARLLAWNRALPELFPVVRREGRAIQAERWSMLRIWFDPAYGVTERVLNQAALFPQIAWALRHELQAAQISGDEPWAAELLAGLLRDLPRFREAWGRPALAPTASAARALVPLAISADGGPLQFRITAEPFTRDPRFRVVYLIPADPATAARYAADAGPPSRTL